MVRPHSPETFTCFNGAQSNKKVFHHHRNNYSLDEHPRRQFARCISKWHEYFTYIAVNVSLMA